MLSFLGILSVCPDILDYRRKCCSDRLFPPLAIVAHKLVRLRKLHKNKLHNLFLTCAAIIGFKLALFLNIGIDMGGPAVIPLVPPTGAQIGQNMQF